MFKKLSTMCFVVFFVISPLVAAQERGPDDELDPKPYDPETEVNMDMFISSWKESMPRHVHGSIIIRDIFTQKPFIKFYTTKRVGGDVTNYESVKIQLTATALP